MKLGLNILVKYDIRHKLLYINYDFYLILLFLITYIGNSLKYLAHLIKNTDMLFFIGNGNTKKLKT